MARSWHFGTIIFWQPWTFRELIATTCNFSNLTIWIVLSWSRYNIWASILWSWLQSNVIPTYLTHISVQTQILTWSHTTIFFPTFSGRSTKAHSSLFIIYCEVRSWTRSLFFTISYASVSWWAETLIFNFTKSWIQNWLRSFILAWTYS